MGALLGELPGHFWSPFSPGVPPAVYAVLGAAAVLAATTQGPISTVLMIGRDRSFDVPLLLSVATATLVVRTIEPRSIYDARLTDEEVALREKSREASFL